MVAIISLFFNLAVEPTQAQNLANKLKGKILLQVQQKGEAWYVNPADEERYYMGTPNDAYKLMRSLGIGVTNDNLWRIPVAEANLLNGIDTDGDGLSDMIEDSLGTYKNNFDTDGDGFSDQTEILNGYHPNKAGKLPINLNFSAKQSGKILLQVQAHGEAWYVNPNDGKRHFLGRAEDAYNTMRKAGLGVTDNDLAKIKVAANSLNPLQSTLQQTPALSPKIGQLQVSVTDSATGAALLGAQVWAIPAPENAQGQGQSAYTDERGVATLTLKAGAYTFKAAKEGYESNYAQASVTAGRTTDTRMSLTPSAAPPSKPDAPPARTEEDCTNAQERKIQLGPTLGIPDYNLFVYVKGPAPIEENITLRVLDASDQLVKEVPLFNDGAHNDREAGDYVSANWFGVERVGEYQVEYCGEREPFEIRDLGLVELVPGHNDRGAERINIILVGSGYDSFDEFKELAGHTLAMDGEFTEVDYTVTAPDKFTGELITNNLTHKAIGFFATEPLRSNRNKFNVWLLDQELEGSFTELTKKVVPSEGEYFGFFGLRHVAPMLLSNIPFEEADQTVIRRAVQPGKEGDPVTSPSPTRSHAWKPLFTLDGQRVRAVRNFGYALDYYPVTRIEGHPYPAEPELFTHEAGHALFDLEDEYDESGRSTAYAYPQCAHDRAQAEQWWGDLAGQVDPFYYEASRFLDRDLNEDKIRVGFFEGGCGGTPDGPVIRPTLQSMMRNQDEMPVFGSVNRRRVEEILGLFNK